MKIIKYILFYLFVLLILLLFFYSDKNDYNYLVNEEAIPIRDYDEIKGMKYTINIDGNGKNKIDVFSRILDSIYHYKDISKINTFFINLKVDNKYTVDDIVLVDKSNNLILKDIDYRVDDEDIIFDLDKEIFTNYNSNQYIKIELEKNTRKI